jgi:hypothetical protein
LRRYRVSAAERVLSLDIGCDASEGASSDWCSSKEIFMVEFVQPSRVFLDCPAKNVDEVLHYVAEKATEVGVVMMPMPSTSFARA